MDPTDTHLIEALLVALILVITDLPRGFHRYQKRRDLERHKDT